MEPMYPTVPPSASPLGRSSEMMLGSFRAATHASSKLDKQTRNPFLHSPKAILALLFFSIITCFPTSLAITHIYVNGFKPSSVFYWVMMALSPIAGAVTSVLLIFVIIWTTHLQRRYSRLAVANMLCIGVGAILMSTVLISTMYFTKTLTPTFFVTAVIMPILLSVLVVPILLAPLSMMVLVVSHADDQKLKVTGVKKEHRGLSLVLKVTMDYTVYILIHYILIGAGIGLILTSLALVVFFFIDPMLAPLSLVGLPVGGGGWVAVRGAFPVYLWLSVKYRMWVRDRLDDAYGRRKDSLSPLSGK